jgi:hypothetical protein
MEGAVAKLAGDPATRQASVTCWDPFMDAAPGAHDYPCVISAGWTVRRGRLEAYTEMRANDIWLGVPGDFFCWTQLQVTVANVLGVPPGTYTHYARSLHLYEKDLEKAAGLSECPGPYRADGWAPTFTGLQASSWNEAVVRAKTILAGLPPSEATTGELEMLRRVEKYL